MGTATTLTLVGVLYEPFGASVAHQVFTPHVTLPNGVKYLGASRFGELVNDTPAFAETLSITHNLASAKRSTDQLKMVFKCPVVRSIDGVDTVIGVNFVEMSKRTITETTQAENERLYWLARTALADESVQSAVKTNDVPR